MSSFLQLSPVHRESSASALYDLWSMEDRIAWQLDAWILHNARSLADFDRDSASSLRRCSTTVRSELKRALLGLGRTVVRLPLVREQNVELSAVRSLQQVFSDTRRAQQLTSRALLLSDVSGDFTRASVLADVQELQRDRLALIRSLHTATLASTTTSAPTFRPSAA